MLRTTLITTVLLVATPAFGQGLTTSKAPAPSAPAAPPAGSAQPPDADKVKRLYAEGSKAADLKQWEKARALFDEAFKLDPRPKIAANLGRAELKVGKAREAAEHLEYFLREDKEADAEAREAVQEVLDEATAKIGTLRVTVDVDGAEVFVGDRKVGTAPIKRSIFVEPGGYTVEARLAGKTPVSQKVGLGAGSKLDVDLRFEGPKAGTGSVGVMGPEGKGKAIPETEPAWRKPAIFGGIGLAVVGIGVGVGFSVAALGKNDEVEAERDRLRYSTVQGQEICSGEADPRCATLVGFLDARDAYRNLAIAGYVVGGLATAGTLAVLLSGPKKSAKGDQKSPSTLMVVPSLGGFVVTGTF